jgi:group I intron endonuclease
MENLSNGRLKWIANPCPLIRVQSSNLWFSDPHNDTMTKIYKITNSINSKSYVGKTNGCIFVRFNQHVSESTKARSINRPLYRAFNKHGVANFSVELIEEVAEEEAATREIYWVAAFDTYKTGYNATIGGDTGSFLNKELIVKTYEELGSGAAVARKLGCHISSVYNILSYCNVTKVQDSLKE